LDLKYLLKKKKISKFCYDFLISEKVNRFELIDIGD